MSNLAVESIGIEELLKRLRTNAWKVPSFQRDFVWSEAQVTSLVLSVIEARPIGMATLWEQPDDSDLKLEPVSIPDTQNGQSVDVALAPDDKTPNQFYAVLDGRQRSTALAMAFGGLRATDSRRRFSGRFYLDVTQQEATERIRYIKEPDVKKDKLDQLSVCIGQGLFPLAAESNVGLMGQWMGYVQAIKDASNYPNRALPDEKELARRNAILMEAFEGISKTVLAVYIVPADYSLGEICEIFETLNTTGTKVSTVDLLHSWLYSDTSSDSNPILLRDWIDDLGQLEGAVGWASRSNRPEIIAQTVTACYVTLESEKPKPRAVGGRKKLATITSLKATDLLATPVEFWKMVVTKQKEVAGYIGGFQQCVAASNFPMAECPYPVSVAMYAGLRWYMAEDNRYNNQWTVDELDALFRAFFWRNALTGRYDQGFLSQSAVDIKVLRDILFRRQGAPTSNAWATEANTLLGSMLNLHPPTKDVLERQLLHAKPAGALGLALTLPVRTRPSVDLLDPAVSLTFPSAKPVELHHIYPAAWCSSNKHGTLGQVLDPNQAEFDYVKSVSNLTPLTRESNNDWKAKTPGQALAEKAVNYSNAKTRLDSHFVSQEAFDTLTAQEVDPKEFWELRSSMIADELLSRCGVHL